MRWLARECYQIWHLSSSALFPQVYKHELPDHNNSGCIFNLGLSILRVPVTDFFSFPLFCLEKQRIFLIMLN